MSRAEAPPNRRLTIALGAVVVIAIGLGFWFKLTRPKNARVPLGVAGFELGASVDETKRSFPKLEPAATDEFKVNTTLLEELAACTLSFANGRLGEIRCTLDAGATPERRRQLRGKVLMTFRQLYGDETSATAGPGVEHWHWLNDRAVLTLDMPPVLATGGTIEVLNKTRSP